MERQRRKVTKSDQIERHFAWLRSKAFEDYQELERLDNGGLSRLLLAGKINGFQLVKAGRDVEDQLRRKKLRVQMLEREMRSCLAELRKRGFTYL